jgi:hypothetical protein
MFEFAALTYGLLASFVMASTSRNRRERRRNSKLLTLFATGLMAFSAAFAVMLIFYVGYHHIAGTSAAA